MNTLINIIIDFFSLFFLQNRNYTFFFFLSKEIRELILFLSVPDTKTAGWTR